MTPESPTRQTLHVSSSDAVASSELSAAAKATSKTLAWCPAVMCGLFSFSCYRCSERCLGGKGNEHHHLSVQEASFHHRSC